MRTRDLKHGAVVGFKNNPEWGKYLLVHMYGKDGLVFVDRNDVLTLTPVDTYRVNELVYFGNAFADVVFLGDKA